MKSHSELKTELEQAQLLLLRWVQQSTLPQKIKIKKIPGINWDKIKKFAL